MIGRPLGGAPFIGRGLGERRVVPGGRPAWWMRDSAFDFDFTFNRAHPGSVAGTLSLTRASEGWAEDRFGIWHRFASGALRITDKGLLVEESRTNIALHNRDLTNAAWVKTNVTATKDQVGIDGVADSASKIVAGANNGTCLQTVTLASSARYQTAFIKRLVGTGNVQMTTDNGSTWTTVTVTAGWTRLVIPSQTVTDPVFGFRLATSGDSVAVDFVQNENGAYPTSPIEVTTVAATRAADLVELGAAGVALISVTAGGLFMEVIDVLGAIATARTWAVIRQTSGSRAFGRFGVNTGNKAQWFGNDDAGTTQFNLLSTNNVAAAQTYRGAGRYAANSAAAAYSSALQATTLTDASVTLPTGPVTSLLVGRGLSAGEFCNGYIRRMAYKPVAVPDADLLAWAQAA